MRRIESFLNDVPKVSAVRHKGKIKIQIYFSREDRKYISTGVAVEAKNWRNGMVVGLRDAVRINAMIVQRMDELQRQLIAMSVNGEELCSYTLDDALKRNKVRRGDFLEYMEARINERELKPGTKINHMVTLNALRRFKQIRSFASLTTANIYKFDMFLRKEAERSQTTLHRFHKVLKVYVSECVRLELINKNPYEQFVDNHGKHKVRTPLTEDMIVMVRDAELAGKYRKTRDLFVLMCYTGLSYVDMQQLRREDIVEREDKLYIKSRREKTGEVFFTPVLPAAREVLERYDYCIPTISNQKMNKYLHDIERMLDIPVPMTCHIARHSFATLMLSYDVPIAVVSKMLGHASTRTTEIYAKVLQENVERKSEGVFARLR